MQVTKNFKLSELEFSDPILPELVANPVELLSIKIMQMDILQIHQ